MSAVYCQLYIDVCCILMSAVYWCQLYIDVSCILMSAVYWSQLYINTSCILMSVVYWCQLYIDTSCIDASCILMSAVYWCQLYIDVSCVLMSAVYWLIVVYFQCLLYESELSDVVTLNVDQSGVVMGISLTTYVPYCEGYATSDGVLNLFNTTVEVVQTSAGPV